MVNPRKGARRQAPLLDPPEPAPARGRRVPPVEEEPRISFCLTPHAKERMAERGILDKDIQIVLEKPDALEPSLGRRTVARKYCGARTLEVVFHRDGKISVVQTAYWLERVG